MWYEVTVNAFLLFFCFGMRYICGYEGLCGKVPGGRISFFYVIIIL
jgi:hypothetical protein